MRDANAPSTWITDTVLSPQKPNNPFSNECRSQLSNSSDLDPSADSYQQIWPCTVMRCTHRNDGLCFKDHFPHSFFILTYRSETLFLFTQHVCVWQPPRQLCFLFDVIFKVIITMPQDSPMREWDRIGPMRVMSIIKILSNHWFMVNKQRYKVI